MLEREVFESTEEVVAKKSHANGILAGSLNGAELSDRERRAILAAEALPAGMGIKKTVATAFVYLESGIFRANEVLGVSYDEAVDARDSVRTDPEYEVPWRQFQILQEDGAAETVLYRRAGHNQSEIAERLGLHPKDVKHISQRLADYGINGRRTAQAQNFEQLCLAVAEADIQPGQKLKTHELAEKLGTTPLRISIARRRNRNLSRPSTLGEAGINEHRSIVRSAIISNQSASDEEVLQLIGNEDITISMIKQRRRELIGEGLVQSKRRRSGKNAGLLPRPSVTEEAEIALSNELDEASRRGETTVVLAELRRRSSVLSKLPSTTVLHIYHRLEKTRAIPSLRKRSKVR